MTDLTSLKDKFVAIYRENITRPGADRLLEYLLSDSSDFFTAPLLQDITALMKADCASIQSMYMSV